MSKLSGRSSEEACIVIGQIHGACKVQRQVCSELQARDTAIGPTVYVKVPSSTEADQLPVSKLTLVRAVKRRKKKAYAPTLVRIQTSSKRVSLVRV